MGVCKLHKHQEDMVKTKLQSWGFIYLHPQVPKVLTFRNQSFGVKKPEATAEVLREVWLAISQEGPWSFHSANDAPFLIRMQVERYDIYYPHMGLTRYSFQGAQTGKNANKMLQYSCHYCKENKMGLLMEASVWGNSWL